MLPVNVNNGTHLVEVRSDAADWQSAFLDELGWPSASGIVGETWDALGLCWFLEPAEVIAAMPLVRERRRVECPFVGRRRGFFGYWLDPIHDMRTRGFDVSAARAGRGLTVDLGPLEHRHSSPCLRETVMFGALPIEFDRIPCIDVNFALDHNNHLLLSDDPGYVAHVQRELDRIANNKHHGKHGTHDFISIWHYDHALR